MVSCLSDVTAWAHGGVFSRPFRVPARRQGTTAAGGFQRIEVDAMPDMQQVLVWAIVLFMLGAAQLSAGLARLHGRAAASVPDQD